MRNEYQNREIIKKYIMCLEIKCLFTQISVSKGITRKLEVFVTE